MAVPRERQAVAHALKAAFPERFTDYTPVDVGVGWLPLVMPLLEELGAMIPGFILDGLKERHGRLHIWLASESLGDEAGIKLEARALVDDVATAAAILCSFCGVAEKATTESLCPSCSESFGCFLK